MCGDLTELVKLLRKSLELTEKLSISLYDELEFVKTYIHLEQGRLGSDFSMDVKIEEDSDILHTETADLVDMPFLKKHAFLLHIPINKSRYDNRYNTDQSPYIGCHSFNGSTDTGGECIETWIGRN